MVDFDNYKCSIGLHQETIAPKRATHLRCRSSSNEAAMLKIIGLKAYRKGYTGCAEFEDRYELFTFSRHTYTPIQTYPAAAFENRRHFISAMGKFIRTSFFLKDPVKLSLITPESLAAAISS
jgi:hypothetical protein